ncbi:MAG: capsular polysaccharide biosynthesis protein CapF [Bacteroidales bacterium]|nr:capsular polysaccharide biosynthesis protein CapF [Bacteroidales bacterium]
MKILITGAKGFVGKNLIAQLNNIKTGKAKNYNLSPDLDIVEYDIDTPFEVLDNACKDCDFVFHLAGVNRPKDEKEFMEGNFGFTSTLLDLLKKYNNYCPIMLSSSIQAALDNPYGKSKRAGEDLIREHFKNSKLKTQNSTFIYRFPNLFGKWCRPNYNSAVATFCNNIANDLPIQVNDRNAELNLVYIDDVVDSLINLLVKNETLAVSHLPLASEANSESQEPEQFQEVHPIHKVTLGEIVDLLSTFNSQPSTLMMPEIPNNSFAKKLYSTYLSYLPKEKVSFPLKMNVDERGSFTELLKTEKCGQFSVNISKPGITKGQHWHNSKWEFFIVVSGNALIQERKIGTDESIEFKVSGEKIEAVHMLPGYTHNIINLSETEDLVTLMWANESFDPNKPDTFFEIV